MSTTVTRPKATKQYRAHNEPSEKPAEDVFTTNLSKLPPAEEVLSAPKLKKVKKDKKAKKAKAVKVLSAKEQVEALVSERGFEFTRGRVYVTGEIVEASVRVLKGGKPEIVRTSGAGRVTAVAVFGTETGDCALQNLVG